MIKRKVLFLALIALLTTLFSFGIASFANDPIIDSIEKQLSSEEYFEPGSVTVRDFVDTKAEITTSENETEMVHLKALFVSYKEKRDDIFYFSKKEIFYYDLDHSQLVKTISVKSNDELNTFVSTHIDDMKRTITIPSLILIMALIFGCLVIAPVLVMIFHRPSSYSIYHNQ